ncbi:hypothetical protein EDB85DRAFT_1987939 [Lactarius pseudohatsudake]|nr:hypothetical protein EDB85DRAFT_1987939 [Lactarius pseudohatsudake]
MTHLPCAVAVPSLFLYLLVSLSPCCSVSTLTICHSFCTLLPYWLASHMCKSFFSTVSLFVSEVRPKGHCFISRRIVLSGSLFGLLGFIGFTLPEQRGVGTFRIEGFPLAHDCC